MRLNVLLFVFFSGALAALSGVVLGAPPPVTSDATTDKARELHLEGEALFKKGQYAKARASYLAAWALKKQWQLAGSLGDCELKLGLYRDAAEHLAYFLRTSPTQPPPDAAEKLYEQARAKTSALIIMVHPDGADLLVDGILIGKSPLADPVFLAPGHHVVEVRLGERRTVEEKDIELGGERGVFVRLWAPSELVRAPAPPAPSGSASVAKPPPSASVAKPITPPKRSVLPGVIVGGAGVVTAGVAAGFLAVGGGKGSDADARLTRVQGRERSTFVCPKAPECADIKGLRSAYDTDVAVGRVMLGVGAAAMVGGFVYLVWTDSGTKQTTIAPLFGAGAGGVTLIGAF